MELRFLIILTVVVINLFLAFLVLKNNSRSATHKIYFSLSVMISLWLIANYLSLEESKPTEVLFFIRLSMFFAMPMSALFLLLAKTLPRTHLTISKGKLAALSISSLIVMFIMLSPFGFTGVEIINGSPSPISGPGLILFAIFSTFFSFFAVYTLVKKLRKSKDTEKKQLKIVMLGILLMLGCIIFTIFIPVVFLKNNSLLPLLPLYTMFFLGLTGFAIIRYRFLNIKLIIAKSILYLALIFSVTAVGSIFTIYLGQYLALQYNINQFVTVAASSILIVTFLDPIRRIFTIVTDRIFYKSKVDYEKTIKLLGEVISEEVELSLLIEKYNKLLAQEIKLSNISIWLPVGDHVFIKSGGFNKKSGKNAKVDSVRTVNYEEFTKQKPLVLQDYEFDLNDAQYQDQKKRIEQRIRLFSEVSASLLLPIIHTNNLIGILSVGNKLSGEPYSKDDIKFFETIAPQLASALQKARLYEEAKEFNVKLQREIEKATADLKAANTKLKDLDQAKSEFMSIASHQLRTPLAGILGYLSMIKDGDYGKMVPEQAPVIKDVLDATQRLIRMVNIFLNVTRIEAGRFVMNYTKLPFADVIEAMYKELKPTADKKGVTLIYNKQTLPEVEVDADKIKDVILNLIDNAIKYSPKGTVTVTAQATDKTVHVMVRDSGVGIATGEAQNLFNKFVRGSEIARVEPNGSGLGLFIAKKITEGHGGKIWAESEGEGKGSTFNFEIPIVADPAAKTKTETFKQQAKK